DRGGRARRLDDARGDNALRTRSRVCGCRIRGLRCRAAASRPGRQGRSARNAEEEDVIIADTGFFLALANRADDDHEIAVAALESLDEGLITTWPVVTETTHLLAARLGSQALLAFVASARAGAFSLFELTV